MKPRVLLVLTLLGGAGLSVWSSGLAIGASQAIRVANWSGGAVFKGPGKQFDRCSAASTNAGGMAIAYAMDRQLRWSLAISNPAWAFIDGFSLSITLNLDGRPFRGRALVRESSTLQIEVEDQVSLFATLRMAAQLRATAGGLAIEFDLANSSEVLSVVAQCALRQVSAAARGTTKTPAGKVKLARIEPSRDAAALTEAAGVAHAIKDHAGIAGFRVLAAVDGLPGSLAAVGWNAESAAGSVMILPPSGAARIADVRDRVIEFEQRKCRGEYFFIAAGEMIGRAGPARVYAACKMPESTAITYYTAVPRNKGGTYVVTNTSGQGFALTLQRQTETADAKLRGAVWEALRRVDQEPAPEVREKSVEDRQKTSPEQ